MTNETAITVTHATGVLQRVGTNQERQYLMEVLAEQLGIPASEAGRADVVAILANAVQRSVQFGWLPGVHMHVSRFETSDSKNARKGNPNLRAVYTYTLVDGEKAWKDSGARWKTEYGVNWRYQRRAMTKEELAEEVKLMGYTQPIAPNSFGYWCRIVEDGVDDPNDPENPVWAAGIWFGKVSVGKYWFDDNLPTGNSSRDVALRRADKRAMMQSRLSLLPVGGGNEEERMTQLVDNLRREREFKVMQESPVVRPPLNREPDGQVILASPRKAPAFVEENQLVLNAPRKVAPVVQQEEAVDGAWEHTDATPTEDVDFGMGNGFDAYTEILHNVDIELPKGAAACMEYLRNAHKESDTRMTHGQYQSLCADIDALLGNGEEVHGMLLSCILGFKPMHGHLPGAKFSELHDWVLEPKKNAKKVEIIKGILDVCLHVRQEMEAE